MLKKVNWRQIRARSRSSSQSRPLTIGRWVSVLGLALLLISCELVSAQCRLPSSIQSGGQATDSTRSTSETLLPESGLLTDDTYTNLYFGFALHLPITLSGHRLMLPIRLAGEHALLGIGFQNGPHYGTFVVTAGGNQDEDKGMTPEQVRQRDEMARRMSRYTHEGSVDSAPAPIHFKRVDKHRDGVWGTRFSANIRDYNVRFTIQTNDKAFLRKSRKAIEDVQAFCTDGAGNFFTTDGKPFHVEGAVTNGPTIPTAVVDEAIRTRPAEHTIPPGTLAAKEFGIPEMDFTFALPAGWSYTTQPPPQDEDAINNQLTERLYYLWRSCARTLLRGRAANGAATLELRVLDQACMGLPFPASADDNLGSESLGEYLEMLGRFGEIKSNRIVQSGGRVFTVYRGTSAGPPEAHELERRRNDAIVATRYNKLIFTWLWSAPTGSNLEQVPASDVKFGDAAPILIGPAMSGEK